MDYQSIMKELLNPSHSPSRSGKDLSHRKVLSLKAGELLPVLCEEMVPNDYFEIDTASLLRTMPLRTAAFIRCRVHYDFFFVPKTSIWRNFDRFYYQRDDRETSYSQGFAYEPNIEMQDLARLVDYGGTTNVKDSKDARCKILQLLGYGNFRPYSAADFGSTGQFANIASKSLTVLPIMGYNRIYNFWYRNAWRDEPNQIDSYSYSADSWACNAYSSSLFGINVPYGTENQFLQMHYHGWFSDLFMGSLPNQQFGSVSTIDTSSRVISENNVTQFAATTINKGIDDGLYVDGYTPGQDPYLRSDVSFDVMQFRRAIALQKWKEYNQRAGWKSRNQARAMFGVSTPQDRKHEIEFIDGYNFPLMVDEVVATAHTNKSTQSGSYATDLGELAGKGIGVGNGKKIKFNSGERHGYLYCIAYILPEVEYDSLGIDKYLVRSEPFDHYVPAFENLGMEPIHKYELNWSGNTAVFDSVIGYSPRYHEYKTRYDKVFGEFMTGKGLSSWVSVRRDLQGIVNSGSIPTDYFYVNPSVLDTVFLQNATHSQTTDQFLLNLNFNFKAVRPMSDLGLPVL